MTKLQVKVSSNGLGSILGSTGCCHHSCTDSPDRLIGNDKIAYVILGEVTGYVIDLANGIVQLNSLSPLLIAFTHTENGFHARSQNCTYLIDDVGIILRMIFTPFRMTNNNIGAAQLGKHIG